MDTITTRTAPIIQYFRLDDFSSVSSVETSSTYSFSDETGDVLGMFFGVSSGFSVAGSMSLVTWEL